MMPNSPDGCCPDAIDNTVKVIYMRAFPTNKVTPVLVTGVHFCPKRDACGTMDTGDTRRYDSFVFCDCSHVQSNFGVTNRHGLKSVGSCHGRA